jgi:two-component system, OmpR family, phosphate regulon sensor histidine kinase PhoR
VAGRLGDERAATVVSRPTRSSRRPGLLHRPARAEAAKRGVTLALAALLGLLVLVLTAGVVASTWLYHASETRYVKQALPLRTATRDVVLQMVNEETGVRGYLISGDRAALSSYFAGRYASAKDLARLADLVQGHAVLEGHLAKLRAQIRSLNGYFARQIAFAADGVEGRAIARRDVRAASALFAQFRRTAAALQRGVDRLIAGTRSAQRRTFVFALATISTAGLLAVAVAVALLRTVPEDLRNRYAAEEEARARAELGANAARALDHITDAVVLVDEDGFIRSWNSAAERLFDVRAEDATGRRAADVIPGLYPEAGTLSARESVIPVMIRDVERWLSITATGFDQGRVLTIRDIAAERALERTRSEFVATASHELRTPVTTIFGAARTLQQRGQELSGRQRERLMELIEHEAQRLTEVVDQILVSSQLDRGEFSLSEGLCDLPQLCRDVIAAASTRRPESGIISLLVPNDIEPVSCDPARLRQVLVNLVENALKYSPPRTPVAIHVDDAPDRVRIAVNDEGPGIPAADQQRIFEKFYRLDPEMSRGVGGSGLGLYISRQLVERMGGSLTVDSIVGRGSTFTIELPRVQSSEARVALGAVESGTATRTP